MRKFYVKQMLVAMVMLLCCTVASAYDFKVNGIYYNINGDEATVVCPYYHDRFLREECFLYRDSIVIPETVTYDEKTYNVTSIGINAFHSCTSLTNITIPESVTSIQGAAFSGCTSLKSVVIPESVTSIQGAAFSGCTSLKSVVIPESVTSIGGDAFIGCRSLTNIYMLNETPMSIKYNTFSNFDATLYVPQGSLAAYRSANVWKEFKNIVEFDPTGIEDITEDDALAFEVTAGGILLTAAEGKAVAVYSVSGALIEKICSYAGEEIALDKGVYILRVGGKAVKVKL